MMKDRGLHLLYPDGKLPSMHRVNVGAEFDRFDVIEALMCIAHDWGEYALYTRINNMLIKHNGHLRLSLTTDTLTENGKLIYQLHDLEIRNRWDNLKTPLNAKNKFQKA
jgi:hypothetical protein